MKNQVSEVITMREFKQLMESQLSRPVYFLSRSKQNTLIVNDMLKRMKKDLPV